MHRGLSDLGMLDGYTHTGIEDEFPQEAERRPGETVLDALARRTGVAAAQAAMDASLEELTEGAPGADDR